MKNLIAIFILTVCISIMTVSAAFAGELNVSAAASLKEAINDLTDVFARKNAGVKIIKNYGASGVLAKQIENGAPADIFISANVEWMDYLKARRLVDVSTVGNLAYNTLVFAGAPSRRIAGMKDLVQLRKIAIGSPKSVPAGEYAMEALKKAGVEKNLTGKLVMAKDVREAMKYAELEEVDGAFVYRTDALLLGKRTKILFTVPESLHDRVAYPLALTTTGAGKREAKAFLDFLRSTEARMVLEKYGFAVK